jgi:hypothetical protein
MDALPIYAVLFPAALLALAGFVGYVCRGRPATLSLSRRPARERRALQEIERHLLAEAAATEAAAPDPDVGQSRQIDK